MEWIGRVFENASPVAIALFASLVFNFLLLRALLQLVRLKSAAEVATLNALTTSSAALTDAATAARETATRVGAVEIGLSRLESQALNRETRP